MDLFNEPEAGPSSIEDVEMSHEHHDSNNEETSNVNEKNREIFRKYPVLKLAFTREPFCRVKKRANTVCLG